MHKTAGLRDPAAAFPLSSSRDDVQERRQANRAIAISAAGLAATGLAELLLAILTGSVGLLGDAIHNLSDVSTSAVVFVGFRVSRKAPTERYPYGLDRAEDLAGIGIAVVIWASAVFAGYESVRKLIDHGPTSHLAWGIFGAAVGIAGNQVVARYKLVVGRRINSATLVADARHSWLDALSSFGALVGLVAVALGFRLGDPIAGIAVTLFICHVGYEVTGDVVHRVADGVDLASSPPPRMRRAWSAAWSMRTLGPAGLVGRCGWKSRAGSNPTSPSETPMPSASRWPRLWHRPSPTWAASPGQRELRQREQPAGCSHM